MRNVDARRAAIAGALVMALVGAAVPAVAGVPAVGPASGGDERFTRGHLFVTIGEAEPCEFGGREAIVEIDPATGEASVFADSSDGLCRVSGLAVAPDRRRLLEANLPKSTADDIRVFYPDGRSELYLSLGPVSALGIAYDPFGDLYVRSYDCIVRYPMSGGAPEVFADAEDFISQGFGRMVFAPNGDLYCTTRRESANDWIVRIPPDGVGSIIVSTANELRGLAVDRSERVFVSTRFGEIFRYDPPTYSGPIELAEVYGVPIALSEDEHTLFCLGSPRGDGVLAFAVDTDDGTVTSILGEIPGWDAYLTGSIIVVRPVFPGDLDFDGAVDLYDFALFDRCLTIGEGEPIPVQCQSADLNGDRSRDFADFAVFQRRFGIVFHDPRE